MEYDVSSECYNYLCPFRKTSLPTSVTRCECYDCQNREDFVLPYYITIETGEEDYNGWSNCSERD